MAKHIKYEDASGILGCLDPDTAYLPSEIQKLVLDVCEEQEVLPVKHSRWVLAGHRFKECERCGVVRIKQTPYCPCCGSRMSLPDDEEIL